MSVSRYFLDSRMSNVHQCQALRTSNSRGGGESPREVAELNLLACLSLPGLTGSTIEIKSRVWKC